MPLFLISLNVASVTLLTCKVTSVKVKDLFGKLPHPRKKEISRCLINKSKARSMRNVALFLLSEFAAVCGGGTSWIRLSMQRYVLVYTSSWLIFFHECIQSLFEHICIFGFLQPWVPWFNNGHWAALSKQVTPLGSQEGLWVGWFAELESSCIWIISKLACFSATYIWILMSVIWWAWEQVWMLVSGCLWV